MWPIATDGLVWSVGRSVYHDSEPRKKAEPIKMSFTLWIWVSTRNCALDWGPDPPLKWVILRYASAQKTLCRMGTELSFPKRGRSPLPNFRPMSIVAKRLYRSRWHLALGWALAQVTLCWMGTQLPSPKRGQSHLQFSAHFYCGQTAGCIKMPLGIEVGLSPGDFVLDGDPAPLPMAEPPNFWPTSIVARWLHGLRCHLARR